MVDILPTMDDFSTFDIQRINEIPRERLRDWLTKGFIKPTYEAQGKGTRASFTKNDLYCIEMFKRLLKAGIHRENAAKYYDDTRRVLNTETDYIPAYIVLRIDSTTGNIEPEAYPLAFEGADDMIISLKTGLVPGNTFTADFEYDQIIIINFLKLRKQVDLRI